MARDGKLVFRFVQTAAGNNQLAIVNYGNSSTASTGAFIGSVTAASTASQWVRGTSNSLNRSGFRNTSADQSIIVSGETSAITSDPAIAGDTSYAYEYVRIRYAPVGPLNTTNNTFELYLEAASDSGTGTAGSDWTIAGSAVPISPIASYATTVSTAAGVVAGVVNTATAHGLAAGQVLFAQAAGTGYGASEPLFVITQPSNATFSSPSTQFGLTKVPGSNAVDTSLSSAASAQTFDRSGASRIITLPLMMTTKPWVRIAYRVLPSSTATNARYSGVWLDNCFLTRGRDNSATF